jgi:hypothetical protein
MALNRENRDPRLARVGDRAVPSDDRRALVFRHRSPAPAPPSPSPSASSSSSSEPNAGSKSDVRREREPPTEAAGDRAGEDPRPERDRTSSSSSPVPARERWSHPPLPSSLVSAPDGHRPPVDVGRERDVVRLAFGEVRGPRPAAASAGAVSSVAAGGRRVLRLMSDLAYSRSR